MKISLLFLLAAAWAAGQTAPPLTSSGAEAMLDRKIERTVPEGAALTKSASPDRETERYYDLTKSFLIRKKESGTEEKLPFLPLPVLFQRNRTELLDAGSERNLKELAAAIKSITARQKDAKFQIEGHASKDGSDDHNLNLSRERAKAIWRVLVSDFGVGAGFLQSEGYGEKYATADERALELELEKDRVVRVVKLK